MKKFRVFADTSVRRFLDLEAETAEEAIRKSQDDDAIHEWGYDDMSELWKYDEAATVQVCSMCEEPSKKMSENNPDTCAQCIDDLPF